MKLVVLATEGDTTWMLVNALLEEYPDLLLAVEQPISKIKLLKRRARRLGMFAALGQLFFMIYMILIRRLNRSGLKSLEISLSLDSSRPQDIRFPVFSSVNSEECIAWLKEQAPDVVILNGTRILSPIVLKSTDAVFLNIHCGITPAYRGVHGGYWAFYCEDFENAGVTIHIVDPGIDTGEVIYQATISRELDDNFLIYPLKQYQAGIPLLKRAIVDLKSRRLATFKRIDLPSNIWVHPTLWQYLSARWTRGVK